MVEVVPAILVKTREDLLERIARTRNFARTMHIDVMDNIFVPNKTIGIEEMGELPNGLKYEFHWMVRKPEEYIAQIRGPHLHIVHVEALGDWEAVKRAAAEGGGNLGIALNPETPLEKILPYIKDVKKVLVMSVVPGFAGQKYMKEVEVKVRELRKKFPEIDIEMDGGINPETAKGAVSAGANVLAAANAIFSKQDAGEAIREIKESAEEAKK